MLTQAGDSVAFSRMVIATSEYCPLLIKLEMTVH
jgi:hypothetical protein